MFRIYTKKIVTVAIVVREVKIARFTTLRDIKIVRFVVLL